MNLNRREFLHLSTGAMLASAVNVRSAAPLPEPKAAKLPRWRGFNLLEKFNAEHQSAFKETDFEWIAEMGFNFVRLPMSYLCWTDAVDGARWREPVLKEIDEAVRFGERHGVHVNLNLHRAPGYCVNPPKEPLDLWTDDKALAACAAQWAHFARRYRGLSNRQVSFDLVNEPAHVSAEKYTRVVRRLVEAIRSEDPDRLIVADGLDWGTKPVPELAGLGVAQSTRGYNPSRISHYRASWMSGSDQWPEPTWPLKEGNGQIWDRERLRRENIKPWQELESKGVGVHVGECGCYQRTPQAVFLAWFKDCLELWQEAGWGWGLWNFRGSFGVLDSQRSDVKYESFRGHQLDRRLLELLQAH